MPLFVLVFTGVMLLRLIVGRTGSILGSGISHIRFAMMKIIPTV